MALDGEDAGLIVELLGHVLTDTLHLAAAATGRGPRLVKNLPPRQMFRQFLALRAVLLASAPGRWLHRLDLGGHGRQVAVQCFL